MQPHTGTAARLTRILSGASLLIVINAIFALTAFTQQGGNFEIKSSVIAGGGGTSTNANTRIDGTVGQGILGSSSGGSFALNGGFWQSAGIVDIAGQITYCAASPAPGVPNATLNMSGGATASTMTNASGSYSFASANLSAGGTFTVTPTKPAQAPGFDGIDTVDAIRAQRRFLGLLTLTGCQLAGADATDDSVVDTADAIAMQRFFLGEATGAGHSGQWRFNPASRTYTTLLSNQTGQNYDAFVLGDTNGDLTPSTPEGGKPAGPSAPSVSATVS